MPPAGRELLKNVAFSLVPLLVLVGLAEGLIRAAGWADSPIAPMTLDGEAAGLMHLDEELFWGNDRLEMLAWRLARRGRT